MNVPFRWLLALALVFLSGNLLGQKQNLADYEIIKRKVRLADSLYQTDKLASAQNLYQTTNTFFVKNNYWEEYVHNKTQLALILNEKGQPKAALDSLLLLAKLADKKLTSNSLKKGMVYHKIGVTYFNEFDDFGNSIFYQKKALDIRLQNEAFSIDKRVNSYNNLGENYLLQGQIEEAIPMLEAALVLVEDTIQKVDKYHRINTHLLYGRALKDYGFLEKAKNHLAYVAQFMENHEEVPYWKKALAYNQVAYLHKQLGKFSSADIYYKKAIQAYLSYTDLDKSDRAHLSDLYYEYGYLGYQKNQIEDAIGLLEKSLMLKRELPTQQIYLGDVYFVLAEIYAKRGEINQALGFLDKSIPNNLKYERNIQLADDYSLLATLQMEQGKTKEAVTNAHKALQYLTNNTLRNELDNGALMDYNKSEGIYIMALQTLSLIHISEPTRPY